MGFALKILGVDFSDSAVAQIVYEDPIPCVSLTLNTDTISFDTVEQTYQLVATVVPNDTTDILTWASSNENVATVVDGLVTIHGIGEATITATCGEHTATATITQTTIKSNYPIKTTIGNLIENYDNYMIYTDTSSYIAVGKAYTDTDDLRIGGTIQRGKQDEDKIESFPVPYGATKAKLALKNNETMIMEYAFLCDRTNIYSHEEYPYGTVNYPHYDSKVASTRTDVGFDVSIDKCFCIKISISRLGEKELDYVYFE